MKYGSMRSKIHIAPLTSEVNVKDKFEFNSNLLRASLYCKCKIRASDRYIVTSKYFK